MGKAGHCAGYLATGAILVGFLCSATSLGAWLIAHPLSAPQHHGPAVGASHEAAESEHVETPEGAVAAEQGTDYGQDADHAEAYVEPITGNWYNLGQFGALRIGIGYYIDGLTIAMFSMVTLVASCIHFYSMGYMHEELEEVTDPLVTLSSGELLKRPGRYYRFFQYLSLFCFSMLGLVLAESFLFIYIFWELVGLSSYLLIGFWFEKKSASDAGKKAFIVNRVGDFGMIIGLLAIWGGLGTFAFQDVFKAVRPASHHHELVVPEGMVRMAAADKIEAIYRDPANAGSADVVVREHLDEWRKAGDGYWLLVIAGLGIFCGCVGKSAQFPLHVWLPDAMEGPTPVSALIHAATMVAAGVYLVGRFYPVFAPEVMLVIAYTGCITLFMAATIAITATDIKRVLAYSTVSQLGYMMFSLGVGGWVAGLFHLFTHAFFKSLLFLCSGSVIHACHTNEMPEMGGLRKKMPWTAYTMLTGCLAISGAGIPLLIGLSGFYSKDSILAQAFSFKNVTPDQGYLFWIAAAGATITAFYMFRLWYMTFAGQPRDQHIYDHAHESPKVMYVPLVILAVFAVIAGWTIPFTDLKLVNLLEQARPLGTGTGTAGTDLLPFVEFPAEYLSHGHDIHVTVSWIAFGTAMTGFLIATVFYGLKWLDPERVRRLLSPVHRFLVKKWYFDELYHYVFFKPLHLTSACIAGFDRKVIDWVADHLAWFVRGVSYLDNLFDRFCVDRLIDLVAACVHGIGLRLRPLQSGQLRLYVMQIALGTVILFLILLYWSYALAGG
jgi:NADH-quinone oxidoreductase subunit L